MTHLTISPIVSRGPAAGGNGQGQAWDGLLEVLQAYHRWQNAFSPAQAAAQEFFGRPPRGLCSLHRDYPRHKHYLLQQALSAALSDWTRAMAVSFQSQEPGEIPLAHVVVPSGPGTWGAALDDARVGYVGPTGDRVMARLSLAHEGGDEVACFNLIGAADQAAFLRTLLDRIEAWMEGHPHLRGAKLDAKGEFLRLDRLYGWDDIVLDPTLQAAVDRHIVRFFAGLDRAQAYGLRTKRGVMLVGPPGTGKTLLGKILCCQLSTTFIWVSPGEFTTPAELQRLFALARECQPTILFLEDLDLYASRRGYGGDTALLGELLNQLDGFPNNSGILTVATTNDIRAIEPALADRPSRFDHLLRLEPPGTAGRRSLLRRFLRGVPEAVPDLDELAGATQGLTGAHLQEVVHLAIQQALDRQPTGEAGPPCVTLEDLREAVRTVRQPRGASVGQYA
jgi:hypothetical protein